MEDLSSWVLAFISSSHHLCSKTDIQGHRTCRQVELLKSKIQTFNHPNSYTVNSLSCPQWRLGITLSFSFLGINILFSSPALKHSSSFHSQFSFFFPWAGMWWILLNQQLAFSFLHWTSECYYRGNKVCNHDSTLNPKSLTSSGLPKLPC